MKNHSTGQLGAFTAFELKNMGVCSETWVDPPGGALGTTQAGNQIPANSLPKGFVSTEQ